MFCIVVESRVLDGGDTKSQKHLKTNVNDGLFEAI